MEIDKLCKQVLSTLLFEETFEHICEDCGISNRKVVADIVKTLVVKDLVRVYELRSDRYVQVHYIEPDYFKDLYFRITAQGMEKL